MIGSKRQTHYYLRQISTSLTTYYQHTIQKAVSISGYGLHSGEAVNLTFKPAEAGSGIFFVRTDLEGQPMIKADVSNVSDTLRSTTLSKNGASVSTVEHVLASIVGADIDNILVEVDNQELPIVDGSAAPFSALLEEAGKQVQEKERVYIPIHTNLRFYDAEKDAELIALPASDHRYQLTSMIDFNSEVLGPQHASLSDIRQFKTEIAPARTFCFLHELEYLMERNLIKGGDLSNALVVVDRELPKAQLDALAKQLGKPSMTIGSRGYLNETSLRFSNEPARHKLLDLVGDLALIGIPFSGRIIASKPGHRSNVSFAKELKKYLLQQKKLLEIPQYDPTKEAVYDINNILDCLPHRFPFLLVDKIIDLKDTKVVGIKNVTYNEAYFQGHFPGHPVMPGVLIVEAMAQTGGVLLLSKAENPKDFVTYFLKMDRVKFRKAVKPGDTLLFQCELLSPIRRGICEMKGMAYVGTTLVAEAELTAKTMKK